MSNALLTLEIYRHAGTWCFTDHARGLLHEPFVLGIPEAINYVICNQQEVDYSKTYQVIFAEKQFPTVKHYLQQKESEANGYWYVLKSLEDEQTELLKGWLCPATLKFFETFPSEIYVSIQKL